jgi:hypothetical protein
MGHVPFARRLVACSIAATAFAFPASALADSLVPAVPAVPAVPVAVPAAPSAPVAAPATPSVPSAPAAVPSTPAVSVPATPSVTPKATARPSAAAAKPKARAKAHRPAARSHRARSAKRELASVSQTTTENVPTTAVVEHPCVPGLMVTLQGPIHFEEHTTINDGNPLDVKLMFNSTDNYQGVKGTDVFGNTYVTSDTIVTDFMFDIGPVNAFPFRFMNVDNVKYLSQNPDIPDFYAHFNVGFTINANGVSTAQPDNTSATCK